LLRSLKEKIAMKLLIPITNLSKWYLNSFFVWMGIPELLLYEEILDW
jgi:hypothetical protein